MQIRFDVDGGEWGICGHNLVDSHSMVESMVASLVARPTVVVHYRMQWNKPDSVVLCSVVVWFTIQPTIHTVNG